MFSSHSQGRGCLIAFFRWNSDWFIQTVCSATVGQACKLNAVIGFLSGFAKQLSAFSGGLMPGEHRYLVPFLVLHHFHIRGFENISRSAGCQDKTFLPRSIRVRERIPDVHTCHTQCCITVQVLFQGTFC